MSDVMLLPDLPGYAHGVKWLRPGVIQCDGCGTTHTESTIVWSMILSGIEFNARALGDGRRMCAPCWSDAGWADTYEGWSHR